MQELQILAQYPFLEDAKVYIKQNGPTVSELLHDRLYERARTIGVERLENGFQKRDTGTRSVVGETDYTMELLSYPIARMIAVCVNDTYFQKRYALGEAYHAYRNLLQEELPFLLNLTGELGLHVDADDSSNKILIFFKDYLRYAPTRYKEWKMVNRTMDQGKVKLTQKELTRLILEVLRRRINDELLNHTCNKSISEVFSTDIQRFRTMVLSYRKKLETAPVGKLSIDKLPPCLKSILSSIQAGENVPHMGRFALVAFLSSLKLSTNDILKLFSSAPDYEEDKTRYQVEHITGASSATAYKSPGCDKMRTYGLCPGRQFDDLCKKISHPLGFYNKKWRQEKQTEKKEKKT